MREILEFNLAYNQGQNQQRFAVGQRMCQPYVDNSQPLPHTVSKEHT